MATPSCAAESRRPSGPAASTPSCFLAGVAGRNFTDRYWQRILPRLDPGVVVPAHHDDFFRPLGKHMDLIANVKLAELDGEVRAVSRDVTVAALPRHG